MRLNGEIYDINSSVENVLNTDCAEKIPCYLFKLFKLCFFFLYGKQKNVSRMESRKY